MRGGRGTAGWPHRGNCAIASSPSPVLQTNQEKGNLTTQLEIELHLKHRLLFVRLLVIIATLVVTIAALGVERVAAAPALILTPASGPCGSRAVIHGEGFPAGRPIDLFARRVAPTPAQGAQIAEVQANSAGASTIDQAVLGCAADPEGARISILAMLRPAHPREQSAVLAIAVFTIATAPRCFPRPACASRGRFLTHWAGRWPGINGYPLSDELIGCWRTGSPTACSISSGSAWNTTPRTPPTTCCSASSGGASTGPMRQSRNSRAGSTSRRPGTTRAGGSPPTGRRTVGWPSSAIHRQRNSRSGWRMAGSTPSSTSSGPGWNTTRRTRPHKCYSGSSGGASWPDGRALAAREGGDGHDRRANCPPHCRGGTTYTIVGAALGFRASWWYGTVLALTGLACWSSWMTGEEGRWWHFSFATLIAALAIGGAYGGGRAWPVRRPAGTVSPLVARDAPTD